MPGADQKKRSRTQLRSGILCVRSEILEVGLREIGRRFLAGSGRPNDVRPAKRRKVARLRSSNIS